MATYDDAQLLAEDELEAVLRELGARWGCDFEIEQQGGGWVANYAATIPSGGKAIRFSSGLSPDRRTAMLRRVSVQEGEEPKPLP
jgi:hypothetical protein